MPDPFQLSPNQLGILTKVRDATIFCLLLFTISGYAQLPGLIITGNPESPGGATWTYQDTINTVIYDLQGILFKPVGTGPFPAVIISHGGGGSVYAYSTGIAQEMVTWGLVCIGTNLCHVNTTYPIGSPGTSSDGGASTPNIQRNMKCWDILASLGYVDTNCIAAHGHSLGAMATGATVGMNPTKFSAASHSAGGVNDAGPQYIKTPQANGIIVPYYLHHGNLDLTVPLIYGQKMDTILTNNGVIHYLDIYAGYNHSQISLDDTMFARTKNWYSQYLCISTTGTNQDLIMLDNNLSLQIYPNPSGGKTTLEFSLAGTSAVSIDIYNLVGEKVLAVENGNFLSGKHTAVFDAGRLESGAYIIGVKTESGTIAKKIIIAGPSK